MKNFSALLIVVPNTPRMSGPIAAIQDHFGPAYRCYRIKPKLGKPYRTQKVDEERVEETEVASIPFRPVHVNTIRALVRRAKFRTQTLAKGYWYEVRGE